MASSLACVVPVLKTLALPRPSMRRNPATDVLASFDANNINSSAIGCHARISPIALIQLQGEKGPGRNACFHGCHWPHLSLLAAQRELRLHLAHRAGAVHKGIF